MNVPATLPRATIDDLYRVEGKAELIGGRIVKYMATGFLPNQVASNICFSLQLYVRRTKNGYVGTDGLGYVVPQLPSGRESFSPDASYYNGPLPANRMRFVNGPPTFAVEVRSESDYTPTANKEYEAKRVDYFQAGTLVVWDVDPIAETVTCYRASDPTTPVLFRRVDSADAEPAVPGWRMTVDEMYA